MEKEIKRLKDEEGMVEPDFELRTKASKNIITKMTQEELTKLQKDTEEWLFGGT